MCEFRAEMPLCYLMLTNANCVISGIYDLQLTSLFFFSFVSSHNSIERMVATLLTWNVWLQSQSDFYLPEAS